MKNSSSFAIPAKLGAHPESLTEGSVRVHLPSLKVLAVGVTKLVGAIALSSTFAYFGTAVVSVAFDWGYECIEAMFGQPDSPQGLVAAMSLWFMVMPGLFSFSMGFSKKLLRANPIWNLTPLAVIIGVALFDLSLDWEISSLAEVAPWAAIALVSSYIMFAAGSKLHEAAKRYSSPAFVASAGLVLAVPSGLALQIYDDRFSYQRELLAYVILIVIASGAAAYFSRSRKLSSNLFAGAIGVSPFLAIAVLNLTTTIISLALDAVGCGAELGWRAPASAACILLVTQACAIAGGCVGAAAQHLRNCR